MPPALCLDTQVPRQKKCCKTLEAIRVEHTLTSLSQAPDPLATLPLVCNLQLSTVAHPHTPL